MEMSMLNRFIGITLFGLLYFVCGRSGAETAELSDSIATAVRSQLGTETESFTDEQLAGITELDLSEQFRLTLTGLSRLSGLKTLSLRDNSLSDLSPLSGLTQLTHLDLGDNRISDLSPLSSLVGLTTLSLNNNLIVDCAPLSPLSKLQTLALHENAIEDVSSLKTLSGLRSLSLNENRLESLNGIQALTSLTSFQVSGNSISSIAALAKLKKLNLLDVSRNRIESLAHLHGLANLKFLDISKNPVRSIAPVSRLSGLTQFHMASSQFDGNLAPLAKLNQLSDFSCTHSHLKNIDPLKSNKSLSALNLQGNDIEFIRGLVDSSSPFTKIDLSNNPLGTLARSFHVPLLRKNATVLIDGRVFDSSTKLYSSFTKIDADSNGALSYDEAKGFVAALELDEFDALDSNHDFVITTNELAALNVILPNSMALVWVGGNDSEMALGTRTSPFDSLKKASVALKKGGTVVLTPGTTLRHTRLSEPMKLTLPKGSKKPSKIIGVTKPSKPIEPVKIEN
jgi:Leucine-rich repeat (LRR) protein